MLIHRADGTIGAGGAAPGAARTMLVATAIMGAALAVAPVLIVGSMLLSRWKWLFYLLLPVMLVLDVLLLQVWTGRTYYLM